VIATRRILAVLPSPERRLLFDINDFDETLQAPWEWDVKRLAASIVLASRELGLGDGRCEEAALTMARSYREHMRARVARHRPFLASARG